MTRFMERELVKGDWLVVDTARGTVCLPYEYAPRTACDFCDAVGDGLYKPDEAPATVTCDVLEYTDVFDANDVYSVERVSGWGARLSAPGYMDATEWSVFSTKRDALAYLREIDPR